MLRSLYLKSILLIIGLFEIALIIPQAHISFKIDFLGA